MWPPVSGSRGRCWPPAGSTPDGAPRLQMPTEPRLSGLPPTMDILRAQENFLASAGLSILTFARGGPNEVGMRSRTQAPLATLMTKLYLPLWGQLPWPPWTL